MKTTSLKKRLFAVFFLLSFSFSTVVNAADRNVGGGTSPYPNIQVAIDAAVTGDIVKVYPGNYTEAATNRYVSSSQGPSGPYTFGLFFDANKPGISVVGVDGLGNPITDYSNVVANVQLDATNNFGPSGVFVNAANITITGLNLYLDPGGDQNKTVEVIGENFTIKYCRLTDGNSLYINDFSFDESTPKSTVTKYTIEANSFEIGTSIDLADGAGYSGPVSGRIIKNNNLDAAGGTYAMISFNGSGTGVPWFVHAVGGAVITGNNFVNGTQYIRQRGTMVDDSQFNWSQNFNSNTFDKSVITLANEGTFTPRSYSYPNSYGTFNNVKRIGAIIQDDIDNIAQSGDVLKVGKGMYNESVTVSKTLTVKGAQAGNDARTRSSVPESQMTNSNGAFAITANNVVINGFTIQNQTNSNAAPTFGYAIYMAPSHTGTQLLNNIIKNNIVGSSLANTGASQVVIKYNWFDSNNQPGSASGAGIYTDEFVSGGVISNVLIDNNKFTGNTDAGIDFSTTDPAKASTGITISNNEFNGNSRALFLYNIVSSSFSSNEIHNSTGTGSGDVRIYGGVNNFTINNNNFSNNEPRAVRVTDDGSSATSSSVIVTKNSFLGYSTSKPAVEIVSGYTGTMNAECNWWGTTNGELIVLQTAGPVDYDPWLTNGTDTNTASGFQPVNTCNGTANDNDGDGVPNTTDCAPYDPNVGAPITYYDDDDHDGFGDRNEKKTVCSSTPPSGYVRDSTDCNDHDSRVHSPITYYKDYDHDGFGDPDHKTTVCSSTPPSGYVKDHTDCNDHDSKVHSPITYYDDDDHDGFGDPNEKKTVCSSTPPSGYVRDHTDCNDHDSKVHSPITYYKDNDHDGFGDPDHKTTVCSSTPPSGYVLKGGDCNDHNKNIHPGAPEIAGNHIDDNCNGKVDEKTMSAKGINDIVYEQEIGLKVSVLPNPAPDFFTLNISSSSDRPVQIRVMDIAGRMLETKSNIAANSTPTIGHSYRPGIYIIEVMQGSEKVMLKCIKQ